MINLVDTPPAKENHEESINDFLSGYDKAPIIEQIKTSESETPKNEIKTPEKFKVTAGEMEAGSISGAVLEGALILTLIDMIIPTAIVYAHKRFSKDGTKLSLSKLRLTKGQKNELTPVFDKVLKSLNVEGNPLHLLILSMLAMYGMNYLIMKQDLDYE